MKKIILISVGVVALAGLIFSGYTLFTKLRDRYISRGYNYALLQVRDTAQRTGRVDLTIDGQTTSLVPTLPPKTDK